MAADCQIAFKCAPHFATNCDPLRLMARGDVVHFLADVGAVGKWPAGVTAESLTQAGHFPTAAARAGDGQLRFLKRQLVLPVSMMSQ
jgi:hypothetical protein